jgi:tryptophan-rich sensory protein
MKLARLAFIFSGAQCLALKTNIRGHRTSCFTKPTISSPKSSSIFLSANSEQLQGYPQPDFDAILKYHGAIGIQMACFTGVFFGLDTVVGAVGVDVPFPALVALFYAISLKSRVLNPLNNQRPDLQNAVKDGKPSKGFRDRVMPSWTPPGPVFPIMWLLIIGPLRAYSSALVYTETHQFLHPAIMALVFHLSVGDVWNTINNTERRFGAAVTGVLCVTASALNAAYQYHGVSEEAGNLLGLPMVWFAVAASLVTATWQINFEEATGERDVLYPVLGSSKTKFAWFAGSEE